MLNIRVQLTKEEHRALHDIAAQDIRLPEHVLRWLLLEEVTRRRALSLRKSPQRHSSPHTSMEPIS